MLLAIVQLHLPAHVNSLLEFCLPCYLLKPQLISFLQQESLYIFQHCLHLVLALLSPHYLRRQVLHQSLELLRQLFHPLDKHGHLLLQINKDTHSLRKLNRRTRTTV